MPTDDYIKRSDAVEALCGQCRFYDSLNDCKVKACFVATRKDQINATPSADVEPVIHCKDCVHSCPEKGHEPDVHCSWWDYPMPPMGFCSKATRKKGEE